jgi:hypothetical protein
VLKIKVVLIKVDGCLVTIVVYGMLSLKTSNECLIKLIIKVKLKIKMTNKGISNFWSIKVGMNKKNWHAKLT